LIGLAGNDNLIGGAGDDQLIGSNGTDRLVGAAGRDNTSCASAEKGVTVSLAGPGLDTCDAKGDAFASIENLAGSRHSDTLIGNGRANVLPGAAGSDLLISAAGADKLMAAPVTIPSSSGISATVRSRLADVIRFSISAHTTIAIFRPSTRTVTHGAIRAPPVSEHTSSTAGQGNSATS
jgi:hypothetical protein